MEEILRSHLLTLARTFAPNGEQSLAALSKAICNDNTFLSRIAEGRNFTVKSFDRAVQWFSDHWPADVQWPEAIQRPAPKMPEAA